MATRGAEMKEMKRDSFFQIEGVRQVVVFLRYELVVLGERLAVSGLLTHRGVK